MNLRRMKAHCEVLLRDLAIPDPFDMRELCDRIAERSGRPIRLQPMALGAHSPCGLWVGTPEVDYIFFERRTSRLHQDHIIAHELGHLLCEHEAEEIVGAETSRLIMPNLDPAMVERVLQRHGYGAAAEQEAEMIASLILQRASRRQPDPVFPSPPRGTEDIVHRLERSLRQAPEGDE
ncbi:hypothetical protein P3T37_004908 [Kitasatospora sp. MAA4]|uniref:hypothetical protein n=1 Tax=Kitasatospora sp. MAA4 TaxID=3035093 RepID=UPI002474A05C|nr:hypothetical protein [Kitasatospora sp. MAA4]MDH6135492.1 hypothetical protein [Kitasatospora sp. MAA4]